MGFDVNRFQGPVDEELICPICSGVLQDPVQVILFYLLLYNKLAHVIVIIHS